MNIKEFEIRFIDPYDKTEKAVVVKHTSETFDMEFRGSLVAILNNGDNSWSLVEGNLDQETVNVIGTAIEDALKCF